MIRVVLDAGVLMDAFAVERERHQAAKNVFELAHQGKLECYVCAVSLDFVFREIVGQVGAGTAWEYLRAVDGMFEIVDASAAMCRQAIEAGASVSRSGNLTFEGALLDSAARALRADFIVASTPDELGHCTTRTLATAELVSLFS